MKPIGLRFKHDGELMIVHQCVCCGKIVNNRVAGDDIPDVILTLLQQLTGANNMLTIERIHEVYEVLYGKR